jgi:ATP-dependent Clp protease adaptor protein ClpS
MDMPKRVLATTMPDTDVEALRRALNERLPRYAVILYNDDYHSMDYVVEALVKSVPDLIVEAAVGIMFEAHNTGSAVVIVCLLEQAELYRDRIRSYGLGVSIKKE